MVFILSSFVESFSEGFAVFEYNMIYFCALRGVILKI